MRFMSYEKDGGPESRVWGFFIVELKWLFSIVLLRFENGSRDAYHSHAFHAVSWLLSGRLSEERPVGWGSCLGSTLVWMLPSWRPIFTSRDNLHKVTSFGRSWVLSFRGPWASTWHEWEPTTGRMTVLSHGRRVVA